MFEFHTRPQIWHPPQLPTSSLREDRDEEVVLAEAIVRRATSPTPRRWLRIPPDPDARESGPPCTGCGGRVNRTQALVACAQCLGVRHAECTGGCCAD